MNGTRVWQCFILALMIALVLLLLCIAVLNFGAASLWIIVPGVFVVVFVSLVAAGIEVDR